MLEVGALEDTVQVEATLSTIQSETSAVGQVIDSQQMRDLPAKGRSFFELALLAPGTTPASPGSFARCGPQAHSGRAECALVLRRRGAREVQRLSHRRR